MIKPKYLYSGLPAVGFLKCGGLEKQERTASSGRKWHKPERYDHFLITTTERDATGNLIPDKGIHAEVGEKPTAIPIILLYDDEHLNMTTEFCCYVGTRRWCHGDGETATRRQYHKQGTEIVWDQKDGQPIFNEVACPCKFLNDKCKPLGTLRCLLTCSPTVGGCYQFRTTSWNSISGCLNSQSLIKAATGGLLRGIPLELRLVNRQIPTPTGNVVMPIVHVQFAGNLVALYEQTRAIADQRREMLQDVGKLETQARLMLAAGIEAMTPEEDAATAVEFYPDRAETPEELPEELPDDERVMQSMGWSEEKKETFRLQFPTQEERLAELAKEASDSDG